MVASQAVPARRFYPDQQEGILTILSCLPGKTPESHRARAAEGKASKRKEQRIRRRARWVVNTCIRWATISRY